MDKVASLGCCVRLLGSSPSPACLRSFVPSCFPAGLVCPCSGLVSKISCEICATVRGHGGVIFFCSGEVCTTAQALDLALRATPSFWSQLPSPYHPDWTPLLREYASSNSPLPHCSPAALTSTGPLLLLLTENGDVSLLR